MSDPLNPYPGNLKVHAVTAKGTVPIKVTRVNDEEFPSESDFILNQALHCIVGGEGGGGRYYAGIYWVVGDPPKPPYPVVFRGRIRAEQCLQHLMSRPDEGTLGLGLAPRTPRVERVEAMPDLKVMTLR